jgi:hypothetical protein
MGNPRKDDHGWYNSLQNIKENTDLDDRRFRCFGHCDLPLQFDDEYRNSVVGMVVVCSGIQHTFPYALSPVGFSYLTKAFRNDLDHQHLNVDYIIHWQDSNGTPWYSQFNDTDEHVQEYLTASGMGMVTQYRGYPNIESGCIDDYAEEVGYIDFGRSVPPYKK